MFLFVCSYCKIEKKSAPSNNAVHWIFQCIVETLLSQNAMHLGNRNPVHRWKLKIKTAQPSPQEHNSCVQNSQEMQQKSGVHYFLLCENDCYSALQLSGTTQNDDV